MALEALKQFVAERDDAINAKIESIAKNDRTGSPTIAFKGQGNIKTLTKPRKRHRSPPGARSGEIQEATGKHTPRRGLTD